MFSDSLAKPINSIVLMLSSEFPPGPGGIGTHAYQLAQYLHEVGWSIGVISSQDYATEEAIEKFNIKLPFPFCRLERNNARLANAFKRYKLVRQTIKEMKPAVIIATGRNMVWLASIMHQQKSVPFVAIGHGLEFGSSSLVARNISRRAFTRAQAIISVSHYTRNVMWRVGIRTENDVVIPNGADETLFKPIPGDLIIKFRQNLGLPAAKIILTVGNTTPRKGQDIVIRALPKILRNEPDVHYLVVGLPTGKERLSQLAQSLGVLEHVHFLGPVDEEMLVCAYNACDVYVMTSRHSTDGGFEGFGIAAVEAALCGKAAVVSQDSGLAEAIAPDETGLLVPQDDPAATAVAILTLLQNGPLRDQMGARARERALAEQTWSKRGEAYHQLLLDLTRHV